MLNVDVGISRILSEDGKISGDLQERLPKFTGLTCKRVIKLSYASCMY